MMCSDEEEDTPMTGPHEDGNPGNRDDVKPLATAQVSITSEDSRMHDIRYTGELKMSYVAYMSAAVVTCDQCTDKPCPRCHRPFIHRSIALQQPFESVMIETPPLYKLLFPTDFVIQSTSTPYHTLVVAYSAVLAHLNDLINPARPWLSDTWVQGARAHREMAYALWKPYVDTHQKRDMPFAFNQKDPVLGRAALLKSYQTVIAAGCLARSNEVKTPEDFHAKISEFLITFADKRILETGDGHRIREVAAFNKKHEQWNIEHYTAPKIPIVVEGVAALSI